MREPDEAGVRPKGMGRGAHALRTVGVLIAGCALAACGTETGGNGGGGGAADASLTGVRWVPQSVTVDGETREAATGRDPHVTFVPGETDEAGGRSGGNVGCNSFAADVTVEGDTLHVSDAVSTAMGCPGGPARFGSAFLEVFEGELTFGFSDGGETLVLTGEDGNRITLEAGVAADAE